MVPLRDRDILLTLSLWAEETAIQVSEYYGLIIQDSEAWCHIVPRLV